MFVAVFSAVEVSSQFVNTSTSFSASASGCIGITSWNI